DDGIRDFHVTGVQTCALPIWGLQFGDGLLGLHLYHGLSPAHPVPHGLQPANHGSTGLGDAVAGHHQMFHGQPPREHYRSSSCRTASTRRSALGISFCSRAGEKGWGTWAAPRAITGASSQSKASSAMRCATSAAKEPWRGASLKTMALRVRRAEARIVSISRGTRVRGSMTSSSTPYCADSRSAALRASATMAPVATTVTSLPCRRMAAWPKGIA